MFAASKSGSVDAKDAQFKNVTMLLHGNGTNGAQNNTFLDSSTNNFTITRNGNTTQGTFTPYGSNWSNYFDGSTSRMSVATSTAFGFGTGDFTIEFWLYYTGGNGYKFFLSTYSGSGNYIGYGLQSGTLTPWVWMNADVLVASSNITTNTWQHHAVVRNGTTLTIYLNGTSIGSTTWNVDIGSSKPLSIGWNSADNSQTTQGYISNFRIVKGTAVYTSAFTPSTTPLTAITNTSILTCQSNRYLDNSTNAFSITTSGSPSVQRFSPFSPTTAYSTSVIGGSGYFDGSDYLNFTDTSNGMDLGNATASFEAWIYPTAATCVITTKYGGAANYSTTNGIEYTIALVSQQFLMYYNVAGTYGTLADPTTGRALNQWYHIVVASNTTTLSMYVNGTRVVTATAVITKPTTRTSVRFGVDSGSTYLTGYLSDVRSILGTGAYDASQSTITVPTAPITAVTNTQLLLNYTNAGILDNAMMNDLETVGNAQISTSVKKYGTGSMSFDGTGDYLFRPTSILYDFGVGDFTIEMFVYRSGTQTAYAGLVSFNVNGGNGLIFCFGNGDNKLRVVWNNVEKILASSAMTNTTWTHVALVRSGATVTCYQDGTSVGTSNISTSAMPFTNVGMVIGRLTTDLDGYYFTGNIDELRISKGVARYTSTFTPPTAAFADKG